VKKPKLLDSYAVLAYLNGEEGAGKVRQALEEARDAQEALLLTEVNAGEVYYILSRKRGMDKADYFLETILPGLPIRLVSTDFSLVTEAARLKASHPLSYADCFAVAAAVRAGAVVLTGDPEFGSVAEIITIEWLCPV
jgi:ribonuclease VapC